MRIDTINLCSSIKGEKGDTSVKIEWQVYDRAAGKVVDTVTTDGHGVQEKFVNGGFDQMLNSAFTSSLGALMDQAVVQKYAKPAS